MSGRIHHVQVAMPRGEEAAARAFYGDLLGFTEAIKPASLAKRGGVWFQTGNIQLHLGVDDDFIPAKKAHVAYEVGDLAAVAQRLVDAGVTVVEDRELPRFQRFYAADPFGNRVEILQPL